MAENTDLTPVRTDPATGYNTYELRDPAGGVRKVELWAASSFVEKSKGRILADPSVTTNIERRMRLLFDRYAGRDLDPTFAMDMVASNLSDEEMTKLYDQRFAFFDRAEDKRSFWSKAWSVATFQDASANIESLVPEAARPYTAPILHPIKSLNNSFEMVNRNTVDKFAQVLTGDDTMTFNTLFAVGVMASKALLPGVTMQEVRDEFGYDQDTHTFKDPETGQALDAQTWMQTKAPGWVQAANFAGEFIDPFMFMFAVKTARLGARTVRQPGALVRPTQGALAAMKDTKGVWGKFKSFNEARHSKSVESFASRKFGWWGTTVDDVDRLTKGDLKWGDYLKGVNMREIAGAKLFPSHAATPAWAREMGFYPKHTRYFEEAAMARTPDHIRTLNPKAPGWWVQHQANIAEEGRGLGKTTPQIAEDIRQEWVKLYDPAELEAMEAASTVAQRKWAGADEELKAMEESFHDPLDGPEWPLTPEERLARQPMESQKAFSAATTREFEFRQEMIAARQSQGSLFQVIDTVPRHAWSPAFRQWLDHATIANVGELGTPGSIMDRVNVKGARTLKNVMAYTPHRAVDVTDDFSHVEFRKLLANTELDVKGFTAADASTYYTKYLKAADDNQRFVLMEQLSQDVYQRMGFTVPQIERIREQYGQFWGEVSDKLSITSPQRITLMDPHLIRRLSRLGPEALEPAAFKDILEKTLRTWKKLAITRPAWFFRVVILSEQPRAAMAGMPNLMTHPLVNLATSQVPGVSKAARGVLGARLAVPGWKSRMTLNYEMMDSLLAGSDMGVALGRAEKAAIKSRLERSLGSLSVNGSPTTTQNFHLDDVITDADRVGYVRGWAEILNDRLPNDELHRLFLDGKTVRDAQQWAHAEAAATWRNKHKLAAGTTDLNRTVKKERRFFDELTRKDPEIINHLRTGNKFHWKDLMDQKPPTQLPLDVFTDRLDRPGLALSQGTTKRLMQKVFDSMSSNPSFWFGRFPGYRLGYANDAARYVGIYSQRERKLGAAAEIGPDVIAGARESKAARSALETSRTSMTPEQAAMHGEYISQRMAPMGPGIRDRLVEELAHNTPQRAAVRAFLDDMTDADELVVFRGHAKGKLWEGEAGNASLDYRQAQKFAGPDGSVTEVHIRKDDIIAIGAAGEDEVLFRVRDAIIPGKGAGLPNPTESLKKIVAHGQGKPVVLSALERRIADWSHQGASFKVRQTFYDLNESSRVADLGRFIAPFGNAWQEEITRWAQLAYQRPAMPYGIMTAWRNKDDLPFSYTDPKSGDEMFAIPWSQSIVNAATGKFNPLTGAPTGISMPLTGRWKNLNILTGSGILPGGGPFLTIPTKVLARAPGGLGHVFQGVANALDPYGGSELTIGEFMPSPFFRAAQKLEDDPAADAGLAQAIVAHHFNRTGGRITPQDEVLMEEQMRALKVVNAAAQITVGSGIKANLAPKVREMVDYMKWAQHNFGNFAQGVFLERYGDESAAYMVNLTQSMTGAPPTAEAEDMLLDPKQKRWSRSKAFWALKSESARGEWDPIASAAQIRRGDREARDIHSLTETAYTITGWYRYGIIKKEYEDVLTKAGLTTRSQSPLAGALKAVFHRKRQQVFDAYPGFQREFEDVDFNAWKQNMRDLYELSQDKVAAGLEGTKGATAYFSEVAKIVPALRAAGFRSLSTEAAEPFRRVFAERLEGIFKQYPDFRLVYSRLGLDAFDAREGDMPSGLGE